jgi:hypothetical protein
MNRVRMTLGVVSAAAVVLMASCGDAPAPMSPDGAEPATDGLQPAAAAMPSHCPSNLHQRSPEQVLDDHRAALAAGDFDAAICNYATDAIVIGDGGIDTGHEQIRSSLEFFNRVFEGDATSGDSADRGRRADESDLDGSAALHDRPPVHQRPGRHRHVHHPPGPHPWADLARISRVYVLLTRAPHRDHSDPGAPLRSDSPARMPPS